MLHFQLFLRVLSTNIVYFRPIFQMQLLQTKDSVRPWVHLLSYVGCKLRASPILTGLNASLHRRQRLLLLRVQVTDRQRSDAQPCMQRCQLPWGIKSNKGHCSIQLVCTSQSVQGDQILWELMADVGADFVSLCLQPRLSPTTSSFCQRAVCSLCIEAYLT